MEQEDVKQKLFEPSNYMRQKKNHSRAKLKFSGEIINAHSSIIKSDAPPEKNSTNPTKGKPTRAKRFHVCADEWNDLVIK